MNKKTTKSSKIIHNKETIDISKLATRGQLAKHFRVHPQTIGHYESIGMPLAWVDHEHKNTKYYNVAECEAWLEYYRSERKKETKIEAETRKLQYDADNARLRYEQRRGELITAEIAAKLVEREYSEVATNFRNLGHQLAYRVSQENDATICQKIIEDAVQEILQKLTIDVKEWVSIQNEILDMEELNAGKPKPK